MKIVFDLSLQWVDIQDGSSNTQILKKRNVLPYFHTSKQHYSSALIILKWQMNCQIVTGKVSNCLFSQAAFNFTPTDLSCFCAFRKPLLNLILLLLLWSTSNLCVPVWFDRKRKKVLVRDRSHRISGLYRKRWKMVHCWSLIDSCMIKFRACILLLKAWRLSFTNANQPQPLLLLAGIIYDHWSVNQLQIHCNLGIRII